MKFFTLNKFLEKLADFWRVKFDFWTRMPSHMRITLGVVVPVALLLLITPLSEVQAGFFDISGVFYGAIASVAFGIAYFISLIAGVIIAALAWLVEVVLNMSTQVVNSSPVKTGFPITLAVTNMGFVAAVIVIAIATILRYKDYAVKKTLPKLIAATLLVNFSLVFAGAIINFADQFTLYFVKQINPVSGDGISTFASAMAGAFNPQREFIQKSTDPQKSGSVQIEGVASSLGAEFGKYLLPVASTSLTLFSLIAIALTLAAFVALLLVRYVYLVILLIVMPFVWLMWIFPGTKSYFSDWWKKFLKQVFFAPVVVFFLYLAILYAGTISENGVATDTARASGTLSALDRFGQELITQPIQNLMNSLVIIGLMFGGMIAANKIGAAGAGTAQSLVMAGTGLIGGKMNAKAFGAAARFRTQGPKPLPQRPTAPQRSLMGRMLHPIETLKHGAAVAGWQAKKAVKPITDPIRERVGGKFEKSMTPQTKYQELAKLSSLELFRMGLDSDEVEKLAAKEREDNAKIPQRKVLSTVARFGEDQRSARKVGSLAYGTAWNLMLKTFTAGIKDFGKGGHPSAKDVIKFLHLHDDDHDDHGKADSHAGGGAAH